MNNQIKNVYAVFIMLALSCSGILSAEGEKKKEASSEKAEIAAAIASVKAERALKVNTILADNVKSKWNFHTEKTLIYFNEAQAILTAGITEENKKKTEDRSKEFLKEANERKGKMYRDWKNKHSRIVSRAWESERTDLYYKHTALMYYYSNFKILDSYAKKTDMDMSKLGALYNEIEKKSKIITVEFNKVFAKLKAKEAEMKAVRDDAKLWVDIQFGCDKK